MHNKLNFLNSFTVLFFIGKVGHFGTLAGLPWLVVFLPLTLDLIFDILLHLGYIDRGIANVRIYLQARRLKAIIEREKQKS